jgi:hypothetical protein
VPIPSLCDGTGLLRNKRTAGVKLQSSEGGGRQDGGTKESEAHFCYVNAALISGGGCGEGWVYMVAGGCRGG